MSKAKSIKDCTPLQRAYRRYTRSEEWKQIKELVLERDHHHCMLCGRTENDTINGKPVHLAVHHNSYLHLGNEREHLDTLITVCAGCHKQGGHRRANWARFKMTDETTPEQDAFIKKWKGDIEQLPVHSETYNYTKHRAVYRCDLDGNVLEEFHTISEAREKYGNIDHCLHGRTKTAFGFKWKYKDEVDR